MNLRQARTAGLALLIVAATAACQGGATVAPSLSPSPSVAGATSYLEFHDAICLAWEDLFRGIGNPDAGTDSELSEALNTAIKVGNGPEVDRLAGEVVLALESGRGHLRVAGGWEPGASIAVAMDPIFVTFEQMIEAKRAAAPQGLDEATRLAQEAFEAAGGMEAWANGLKSVNDKAAVLQSAWPSGFDPMCENVPVQI